MVRRILGGVFIFFSIVALLSYKFYPIILTLDNFLSLSLRKFIYIIRVLGGEESVEIMIFAFLLVFLPILFKKPFYYFFKNLLGVELSVLGWCGVFGISNQGSQPYIVGLLPYDFSTFLSRVFGITFSYIIALLLLLFGIFLVLTSYKTSSRIVGVIVGSVVISFQKMYEFIRSLFEYSENGVSFSSSGTSTVENKTKSQSPENTKFYYSNHNGKSNVSDKTSSKFIEITEIDDEDISEDYSPFRHKPHFDKRYTKEYYSDYDQNIEETKKVYPKNEIEIVSHKVDYDNFYSEDEKKNYKVRDVEVVDVSGELDEENFESKEETFDNIGSVVSSGEVVYHSEEGSIFSGKYPPPIELLDRPESGEIHDFDEIKEISETKKIIQDTFSEFKIDAVIEGVVRGPVVTMYEVRPKPGTKIAKIVNISDNLALNLATSRVRMVYPIPGKSVIGIEIPNKVRKTVRIREVIESKEYGESKSKLPLVIGVDIHGKPIVEDLTQMPHLLIAGSTGSGKSVYVNSIIAGLLYSKRPDELKFIMIDLKIVELKVYNGIPHLLSPVITTPNLAKAVLEWLVDEMQYRYRKLESLGCRDITQYNAKVSKLVDEDLEKLPYIVLIIDEYADLMMTSPKETEDYITRLAAMSRAVGIHLIIATQRPSVDVVTGLIKANFPARVAFRVASKVDSRTILDTIGAEKLLGKGDLLFMSPSHPTLLRVQGCFISNEEVERVVEYLIKQDSPNYIDLSTILDSGDRKEEDEEFSDYEDEEFSDELYNEAIKIVITEGKASASYLQRRLRIGYNRAARMIERMEEEGIVGPQQGSKPREILVDESYLEKLN